ncbi:serine/threonine-protein kinase [Nannocystis pusilla]|uniref:Serine/threonine-protein kinase n=1 Tax=Nannocystis pusilla TaxID=889268 RepID=A0ABS7TPQ2_9BACT|nr:serine/threonine-protein kinase [Nannocystis pusilla]MBZ5710205.1 serine/threonine-protein kinase [Nannocystis pusilla]
MSHPTLGSSGPDLAGRAAWAVESTLERPPGPPAEPGPGGPQLKELILSRLFASEASPPQIGRFTLLRLLGEGGMGTVYAAYDEDLDRKVAIKLVRAGSTPQPDRSRARMLREAKLTAQLSHPNVITVHEVGEHAGQIFIAMEFVRGQPLDRWLLQADPRRPDWRSVIAVFAQAGAGLVAAHRAGLVHRDFKPQNVIVRDDGGVKVLDFGLACASPLDEARRSSEDARDRELPPPAPVAPLTQTGAVLGTPAYMSPEQHLGQATDERSDQFSFCVALWEALHGQHPFEGSTFVALQASVLAGRVRPWPANSPVPARLRRLLVRGLAVRPEDRHPSLAELLTALAYDPAATRRRWWAAGGLVVAASIATYALAPRGAGEQPPPCSGVADEFAAVWNDPRRDAVAAAIRATGLSYAEATWTRVEAALDAYARDWVEMRAQSCQAHADALESDRHYDLRTACLARRRAAVDALTSLLAQATDADVENAARAVSELPSLAACADTEALAAALPPPEDPAVARAVDEHRGTLAQAREYEALGRYDEARAWIAPVLASAEARAYTPLAAEAALALGAVELSATRFEAGTAALSQALEAALRAGQLDVAAEALARRIFTQGQTGATQEALHDVPLARALVDRSRDEQLRWLLQNNIGAVQFMLRRLPEAREHWLAALATKERLGDEHDMEYALTLGNLGSAETARGDIRSAWTYQQRSLAVAERVLGPEHPATALMSYGLARIDHYSGRLRAAQARMNAATEVMARAYGRHAEGLFDSYLQLAALSNDRRAFADTLEFLERASAVRAAHDLAAHRNLLYIHVHRAVALAGLGRHADASAELDLGMALVEAAQSSMHDPADVHDARGRIALARGDAGAALAAHRLALTVRQQAPDSSPALLAFAEFRVATALHAANEVDVAATLATTALARFLDSPQRQFTWVLAELRLGLGDILLDAGRPAEALEHLETARLDLAAIAEPDNPTLARLEFGVARALHHLSPAERERATALARGALASLRGYGPGFRRETEAVERFLRDRLENRPSGPIESAGAPMKEGTPQALP